MKYEFDTQDYDSPALLEKDEIGKDLKFFLELETEIIKARKLYLDELLK